MLTELVLEQQQAIEQPSDAMQCHAYAEHFAFGLNSVSVHK